jgi:hypothetical protein
MFQEHIFFHHEHSLNYAMRFVTLSSIEVFRFLMGKTQPTFEQIGFFLINGTKQSVSKT